MNRWAVLIAAVLGQTPSFGSVIRVPDDEPTVDGALGRARTGDRIEVGPGRYRVRSRSWTPSSLTIRGEDATILAFDDETRLAGQSLTLESMGVERPRFRLTDSHLVVRDVEVVEYPWDSHAFVGARGTFFVDGLFSEGLTGWGLVSWADGVGRVKGLKISGGSFDDALIAVSRTDGASVDISFTMESSLIEEVDLRGGGLTAWDVPVLVQECAFVCVSFDQPVLFLRSGRHWVYGLGVWGVGGGMTSAVVALESDLAMYNVTLGVDLFSGSFIGGLGANVSIADSVFLGSATANATEDWALSGVYAAEGTTGAPDEAVHVEPGLWGSTNPRECEHVTFYPGPRSPLIDAGDPFSTDRDGSRADVGATGGPFGLNLAVDADGDRYPTHADCNDTDRAIHPGVHEVWYDGVDQDCDGNDRDQDGDGFPWAPGQDCDDTDAQVNPGAEEVWYDGTDQDCDGRDQDEDGDGSWSIQEGGTDCNDKNPDVGPHAMEVCYDGQDQDCDGRDDWDCDRDGYVALAFGGDDCDDENAGINPGAIEDVGVRDLNCDGLRDPTSRLVPASCSVAGGGTGATWALLSLLALVRRRGAKSNPG